MKRLVVRYVRTLIVALVIFAGLAELAVATAEAQRRGRGPECDERDVKMMQRAIDGKPYFALIPHPSGPEGVGIIITSHIPLERRRTEALEQDVFDRLLAEAKAFREEMLALRRTVGWNTKVFFAKTPHFVLGWDITAISLHEQGNANLEESMLTYAERAERIWRDMEAVLGPMENTDVRGPIKFVMHDQRPDCEMSARKLNKQELHPGPSRGVFMWLIQYWDRTTMPTDNDLWEAYTHFIAGAIANQWKGPGKDRGTLPGWLDEAISYYFTRIHRELDSHTTILFSEQAFEQAAHIDGAAWKNHAKSVAKNMADADVRKIFDKAMSMMTQDDRIIAWSLICYIVEYSLAESKRALEALNTEDKRENKVTLEEWMGNELRFDKNGDLQIDADERAEGERLFREWDLNGDGEIDIATEAIAHKFRQYLKLQKGGPGAHAHRDALQQALGWSEQDWLDRWRSWLDGREFVDRTGVDLTQFDDWRKYERALDGVIAAARDELTVAKAVISLARWQTTDGVEKLYEILEAQEKRVEKGEIDRPIKVYEAAQAVVANMSAGDALNALFSVIIDGRCGRARCENITVRSTLCRGLGKNRAGSGVNAALGRACAAADFAIKVAALDTLSERGLQLGADEAQAAAIACLGDESRAVRSAACACLARLANKSDQRKFLLILDALVEKFFNASGTVRDDLYNALKEITGDDAGPSYPRWAEWARLYRAAVSRGERDPQVELPAGRNPGNHAGGTAEAEPPPTYFGQEINAEQIVFLVDRSYSMIERLENQQAVTTGLKRKRVQQGITTGMSREEAERAAEEAAQRDDIDWSKIHTKWDLARETLISTLKQLRPRHKFTVILFDHRIFVWSDTLVPATEENVKKAIDWIVNQPDPEHPQDKWGLTNIYDAIAAALEVTVGERIQQRGGPRNNGSIVTDNGESNVELAEKGAEEIRLLTDGNPTDGRYVNTADLLGHVRELNRSRKVRINTYGIGQHDRDLCGQLANQNNGKYEDWTYDSGIR